MKHIILNSISLSLLIFYNVALIDFVAGSMFYFPKYLEKILICSLIHILNLLSGSDIYKSFI